MTEQGGPGVQASNAAPNALEATAIPAGTGSVVSLLAGARVDPARRQAMIRLAAYRLYVRRGCVDGHAEADWFEAETLVDRALLASLAREMSACGPPR